MSDTRPCDCIEESEYGFSVYDCTCGNPGDLIEAAGWCATQNADRSQASRTCANCKHHKLSVMTNGEYCAEWRFYPPDGCAEDFGCNRFEPKS